MTSNHNYECFNGGCHGMAANGSRLCVSAEIEKLMLNKNYES